MPVYKYRTLAEASEALYQSRKDERYWEELQRLWELAEGFGLVRCQRGVFRFRTLEEAQEWRRLTTDSGGIR